MNDKTTSPFAGATGRNDMLFQKFVDLLPYFGFQMRPAGPADAFLRSLPDGVALACVSERELSLHVPKGRSPEGLDGAGFVPAPEVFPGRDAYAATVAFGKYGDLLEIVEFLLSGVVGAFHVGNQGCVVNEAVVRVMANASEFLNESDLAALLEQRKAHPDDAVLNNFIGKFCIELGQEGEAAGYFTDAAKAEPRFAEPYSNLGALMWRAGFKEKAFELFSEALLRQPFSLDIQDNFIGTGLELGLHARMKESLVRVESCFPEYSGLIYLNALLSLNLGNQAECKGLLNDLLQKEPEDERALSLLQELE
jgi:tetratricopeptide (TPR) repeat protein